MRNQLIIRIINGIPIGIAIGFVISIAISIALQDGSYHACPPALITTAGSELNAVIVQTVLSGILGATLSAASLVWKVEEWGLTKQTVFYFLICAVVIGPFAYINHWMPHSLAEFLSFYSIFFLVFFIIWIAQYVIWKYRIQALNKKIK